MATEAQIKANRENSKKAKNQGRPKSSSTLKTQMQREMLLEILEKEVPEIYAALIEKAKTGDVQAAKEIFDRAYGKAPQALTGLDGADLKIIFDNAFASETERDS